GLHAAPVPALPRAGRVPAAGGRRRTGRPPARTAAPAPLRRHATERAGGRRQGTPRAIRVLPRAATGGAVSRGGGPCVRRAGSGPRIPDGGRARLGRANR